MSYLRKLLVAKTHAVRSDALLHEHVLVKANSYLTASIVNPNPCADVITDTEELISNDQGSANGNLSPESWNRTESRTVIIWDEGRSVIPPQEVEHVRIH